MGELFELTRSPQLNEVIRLGREILEGSENMGEFKESLERLNSLRREMRRLLRHEMKFQAKTALLLSESSKIEAELDALKGGIEEIFKYIKHGKHEHVTKGLQVCRESFESLFRSFDILKEDEEKRRVNYSESPYQDELMRVGFGVIKGTIKPEAFRERLETMRRHAKAFYEHYNTLRPDQAERQLFEEKKEEIRKTLKSYVRALEEAALYFRDGGLHHIEKGLNKSLEASRALIDFHRELSKQNEAHTVMYCFRCGNRNPVTSKFCAQCNAALPHFGTGADSTVELRMNEEGEIIDTSRHVRTQFTETLVDAVSKVRSGSLSREKREKFERTISALEQKAFAARRDKKNLPLPGELLEGEGADFFREVDEMLNTGISDILEGMGRIKRYIHSGEDTDLSQGLETALLGADKLYQVKVLSDEMKKPQG